MQDESEIKAAFDEFFDKIEFTEPLSPYHQGWYAGFEEGRKHPRSQPMPDAPLPIRPKTDPWKLKNAYGFIMVQAEYIACLVDRINTLEDANTRLRQELDQVKDRLDEHVEGPKGPNYPYPDSKDPRPAD